MELSLLDSKIVASLETRDSGGCRIRQLIRRQEGSSFSAWYLIVQAILILPGSHTAEDDPIVTIFLPGMGKL